MEATAAPAAQAAAPVDDKELPKLTVPQWLAFGTFLIFVALAFFSNSVVEPSEFSDVQKLAIFLIGALLPSDIVIRYGRTQFMKGREQRKDDAPAGNDGNGNGDDDVTPEDMPRTTLPQLLAFGAFLVTVALTIINNEIVTTEEFGQVNEVLRVLIVALLPSEAVLRLSRALYLKDKPDVGKQHAKLI
jgi:hypothetical protein